MEKLNTYYEHSAESDVHLMAMGSIFFPTCSIFTNSCVAVLDPTKKMSHFHKHWPLHLIPDIEDVIQTRVCFSIFQLYWH